MDVDGESGRVRVMDVLNVRGKGAGAGRAYHRPNQGNNASETDSNRVRPEFWDAGPDSGVVMVEEGDYNEDKVG